MGQRRRRAASAIARRDFLKATVGAAGVAAAGLGSAAPALASSSARAAAEDNNPDCFYRFIADTFGDLSSGTLQALRIKGQPGYDTIKDETVGEVLSVDWVTIPDLDRPEAEFDARTVEQIARSRGAARF